jgi:DNA modification methylase
MTVTIINADVLEGLSKMADESVHCCVTSPPYFGLRNYGVDGQIGLEPTPVEFVDRLVGVFREVRRVLRDDGSLWVNMGDSYNNADKWGGGGANTGKHSKDQNGKVPSWEGVRRKWSGMEGCKPKDLIGIPWMLAFALRADGWWLRSGNVWAKPNGMPESQRDRPVVGHEFVFQLTKSERYYYGYEDVRLPPMPESVSRLARAMRNDLDGGAFVVSGGGYAPPGQPPHQGARRADKQRGHSRRHAGFNERWDAKDRAQQQADGAALRSVWWIAPGGFPDAHFATMPEELAALLVQAGCPKGGTVLDPFGGAGTTGLVADRLQRNAVLIELNPEYAAMAERRLQKDRGALLDLMEPAEPPLFSEAAQ